MIGNINCIDGKLYLVTSKRKRVFGGLFQYTAFLLDGDGAAVGRYLIQEAEYDNYDELKGAHATEFSADETYLYAVTEFDDTHSVNDNHCLDDMGVLENVYANGGFKQNVAIDILKKLIVSLTRHYDLLEGEQELDFGYLTPGLILLTRTSSIGTHYDAEFVPFAFKAKQAAFAQNGADATLRHFAASGPNARGSDPTDEQPDADVYSLGQILLYLLGVDPSITTKKLTKEFKRRGLNKKLAEIVRDCRNGNNLRELTEFTERLEAADSAVRALERPGKLRAFIDKSIYCLVMALLFSAITYGITMFSVAQFSNPYTDLLEDASERSYEQSRVLYGAYVLMNETNAREQIKGYLEYAQAAVRAEEYGDGLAALYAVNDINSLGADQRYFYYCLLGEALEKSGDFEQGVDAYMKAMEVALEGETLWDEGRAAYWNVTRASLRWETSSKVSPAMADSAQSGLIELANAESKDLVESFIVTAVQFLDNKTEAFEELERQTSSASDAAAMKVTMDDATFNKFLEFLDGSDIDIAAESLYFAMEMIEDSGSDYTIWSDYYEKISDAILDGPKSTPLEYEKVSLAAMLGQRMFESLRDAVEANREDVWRDSCAGIATRVYERLLVNHKQQAIYENLIKIMHMTGNEKAARQYAEQAPPEMKDALVSLCGELFPA